MIIISSELVLSPGPTIDLTAPVVGWQNVVTPANVSANSQAVANPATDAANPSTYLRWRSLVSSLQYLTSTFASPQLVSYAAIASHNFGTAHVAASIQGAATIDTTQKVLLHFEGADASTTATDSNVGGSAHTWTALGNAQIDTALFKIGTSSALFDGAGDAFTTPDSADFTIGLSDFTIDFWFNTTLTGGSFNFFAGQGDTGGVENANTAFVIYRSNTNVMVGTIRHAGGSLSVTGTTQFTNLLNPGWHHFALVRVSGVLKMFIDGVQEGGDVAANVTVINSTNQLSVGRWGEFNGGYFAGSMDEFRMLVGRAAWTANFTPDVFAYDQFNWQTLGAEVLPADNSPIIWRFTEVTLLAVRLRVLPPALAIPEVAVFYAGKILQFQRRIYVGHSPLPYNRKSNVVTGFSDEATFLGRIVLGELNETQLSLSNITAAFFRTDMDPWLKNSVQYPFFFAWRPSSYPAEVGFCWLSAGSQMSNQRPNGMVQVTASLRGVVQ